MEILFVKELLTYITGLFIIIFISLIIYTLMKKMITKEKKEVEL